MGSGMLNGTISDEFPSHSSKQQIEAWQTRVARKQQSCHDKIPPDWLLPIAIMKELQTPLESRPNRLMEMNIPQRSGIMSERELSITEDYKVASLLGAMNSSELTALEVTVAFSKRAAIAGQLVSEVQLLALKSGTNFLCAIKLCTG